MTDRDRTPLTPDESPYKQKKIPSYLKSPCHPKPAVSTCNEHPINKRYPVVIERLGLRFSNSHDAKSFMDRAQWAPNVDDATIPQTDEAEQDVVKQLFDAFKDLREAKDTAGSAYRKRFTSGEYSDDAIEACAWDILRMVKSIHTDGFIAPIYAKSIIDSISQTKDWSFQDRIEWIKVVLKTSKCVADTLMKNEKNWTTIGAPHKLYSSTLTNSKSNGARAGWIITGREQDAAHQGRPNKRRKAGQHAADKDVDTMGTTIDMNTAILTTPKQLEVKVEKRKRVVVSPPAAPSVTYQYAPYAYVNPPPPSQVVASPPIEVPGHAVTAAPSVSLSISDNVDVDMLVLLYGELPKGGETDQAQAAVGGDDASNNGDDEDAATEDVMAVDEENTKIIIDRTAPKDDIEDTIMSDTISQQPLRADSDAADDLKRNLKADLKTDFNDFDNDSGFSDVPDDLSDVPDDLSHTLGTVDLFPAAAKTNPHIKDKNDALELPLYDAATLEGARALAALVAGVGVARLMCQS